MITNGIGYSPIDKKVYLGKQLKLNRTWAGPKKDITNEFVGVALEYFKIGEVNVAEQEGKKNFIINVDDNIINMVKVINFYKIKLTL